LRLPMGIRGRMVETRRALVELPPVVVAVEPEPIHLHPRAV
jgi:hypothetical protein